MGWGEFIGPAVVAAVVSGIISVVAMLVNRATMIVLHKDKLGADRDMADLRFSFDKDIAQKKFSFDKDLAERKVDLDLKLAHRKRQQELAEEVLAGFYEVRHLVQGARSPVAYAGEGKTRKREPNETDNISDAKDKYFAILERLEFHQEIIAKLMSRQYRMIAWFGRQASDPFLQLSKAIWSVKVAAHMLVNNVGRAEGRVDPERFQKWEEKIWDGYADSDEIAKKVDDSVAAIEALCQPVLSTQPLTALQ